MGILCFGCFVTTLIKSFDQPKYRPVRGIMFCAAGLSSIGIFINIAVNKNSYKIDTNVLWYAIGGYIYI
jgi:predicted membrane channel-forming protein YqfA (hemolysin III family)